MKPYICGIDGFEDLLDENPELSGIARSWEELDGSTTPCDRARAEATLKTIFSRSGLSMPAIRWWASPIAMLIAHEVHGIGLRRARVFYGDAIFRASPELKDWLDGPDGNRFHFGRPIGIRACRCSTQTGRTSALDCPMHRILIGRQILPSTMEKAKLLASLAQPIPRNREIEEALLQACNLALERTYRGDEDWGPVRDRPVFTSNLSIWPGQLASPLLAWEFAAALSSRSLVDSCIAPFIDLTKSVPLAILRESECWLSDRPQMAEFDRKTNLHAKRSAALTYRDGTRLYLNFGTVLPPEYVERPESVALDVIDGPSAPFRREKLIELYGIERYLSARGAVREEASDRGILWMMQAGAQERIRILEISQDVGVGPPRERLFWSLPDHVATLAEALEFTEDAEFDYVWTVADSGSE